MQRSCKTANPFFIKAAEPLQSTLWQMQVAEALREGRPVEPEAYDCVTIFFSDVPDFQNICTKLAPLEVSPDSFWALAGLCPLC